MDGRVHTIWRRISVALSHGDQKGQCQNQYQINTGLSEKCLDMVGEDSRNKAHTNGWELEYQQ
jgi:hypothetical protein